MTAETQVEPAAGSSTRADHARHALAEVRSHLKRRALRLVGFLVVVYAVLKLIPALEQALHALENASWKWVVALLALEVVSEAGFVFAWGQIVDPQNLLAGDAWDSRRASSPARTSLF